MLVSSSSPCSWIRLLSLDNLFSSLILLRSTIFVRSLSRLKLLVNWLSSRLKGLKSSSKLSMLSCIDDFMRTVLQTPHIELE
ncbi:hypothetical protein GDO81_024434 [Engystomops pustulosus]|uniref:Uncharacterized protein n=1 Tax=Engystomops pustulosus TaxID=76066 RepID=A0AAV6Z2Z0_ENGPU|nr:hypothetical protein GDO81_024434 [Engystomops pustulosus]